jgi:predicted ATP-grasp superfamily ATP-dependent carboligase
MAIPSQTAIVLNSNKKSLTRYSRYYKGINCPCAKNEDEKYIDFLINLGKQLNKKGVLFPVGDIELSVVFKNKSKLDKYYAFLPINFHIIEKLVNKRRFYEILDKLKNQFKPYVYFSGDCFVENSHGKSVFRKVFAVNVKK